jgi:hypothetical protein
MHKNKTINIRISELGFKLIKKSKPHKSEPHYVTIEKVCTEYLENHQVKP